MNIYHYVLLIFSFLFNYLNNCEALNKSLDNFWLSFKLKYKKNYSNIIEETKKRLIWEKNLNHIENHNLEHSKGKHLYTLKINQFGDLTTHEFKMKMNSLKLKDNPLKLNKKLHLLSNYIPEKIDWRLNNSVTAIKDQGLCGSCWAFSAVAALEAQNYFKTGKLVSLSEQNLVDCSRKYGNYGCNGGFMDNAFIYIRENKGIDTEESYPYEAKDGACRFKKENIGATLTDFYDIKRGDEKELTKSIANIGPISVGIDAGHISFQFYSSGIYSDDDCSSTQLDHGVTVVGYSSNGEGQDYYIVKNSWGTEWGDQGYILMARNKNNMCGIASAASYPIV